MEISSTTKATASPFSVDLIENSLKHKWFLRTIHELGISLNHIALVSFQRYVDCWLPLVDKQPSTPLIPPADVAWLWHCHRLAPKDYEEYVVGRFGRILEATFPFSLQYDNAKNYSQESLATQDMWTTHFPDKPFFVEDTKILSSILSKQVIFWETLTCWDLPVVSPPFSGKFRPLL